MAVIFWSFGTLGLSENRSTTTMSGQEGIHGVRSNPPPAPPPPVFTYLSRDIHTLFSKQNMYPITTLFFYI